MMSSAMARYGFLLLAFVLRLAGAQDPVVLRQALLTDLNNGTNAESTIERLGELGEDQVLAALPDVLAFLERSGDDLSVFRLAWVLQRVEQRLSKDVMERLEALCVGEMSQQQFALVRVNQSCIAALEAERGALLGASPTAPAK